MFCLETLFHSRVVECKGSDEIPVELNMKLDTNLKLKSVYSSRKKVSGSRKAYKCNHCDYEFYFRNNSASKHLPTVKKLNGKKKRSSKFHK
ncbi:hypothetical protein HK099_003353, partial [Clydaea vesicula]